MFISVKRNKNSVFSILIPIFILIIAAFSTTAYGQSQWKSSLIVPGAKVLSSGTVNFNECYTAVNSGSGNWYKCSDNSRHHPMNWNSVWAQVHKDIDFQLKSKGVVYIIFKTYVDKTWRYDGGGVTLSKLKQGKWENQWLGNNFRYAVFRGERLVSTGPYADQPGPPPFKHRINPDGKVQFWESLSTFTSGQYKLTLTAAMFHNNNTTEKKYYPCRSEYKLVFVPDKPVSTIGGTIHSTSTSNEPNVNNNVLNNKPYVWIVNNNHNVFRWNGNSWEPIQGKATDIGVGSNGTVWITGIENHRYGHSISRWMDNVQAFVKTDGQALRIDVNQNGFPWVVNNLNDIYLRNNKHWKKVTGNAIDIGVGPKGDVCIIGTNKIGDNFGVFHWNGSGWDQYPGAAVRIDVDSNGNPWVVNSSGNIYKWSGMTWEQLPGLAYDIALGPDTAWVIGRDNVPGGHGIYKWNKKKKDWDRIPGGAVAISVGGSHKNNPQTTYVLKNGTYNVDVNVGGTMFHSTWDINIVNSHISGTSHWACCPGPRNDSLRGSVMGNSIQIQRDCSGQGWNGGCIQTYKGIMKGNKIEGTGTGTGLDGLNTHWTLYLNSWKP